MLGLPIRARQQHALLSKEMNQQVSLRQGLQGILRVSIPLNLACRLVHSFLYTLVLAVFVLALA